MKEFPNEPRSNWTPGRTDSETELGTVSRAKYFPRRDPFAKHGNKLHTQAEKKLNDLCQLPTTMFTARYLPKSAARSFKASVPL